MLDSYIYTFNRFLQERFGERVHKLSLNPGWGCPNKDGRVSKDGCLFCNEDGFSFFKERKSIIEQIPAAMEAARKRFNANKFIAYFQEGSSTAAPLLDLQDAVEELRKYPDIVGIFLSSRPDSINPGISKYLSELQKKYLVSVEIGMQTANDPSLAFLNRNHTHQQTRDAIACIRAHSTAMIGAHLILGIPGETEREYLHTLDELKTMGISGAKFHLFHILKNTRAEQLYSDKKISLLTETEYRDWLIFCLERISKKVFVERLISTAAPDCLIAPLWMNNRALFLETLEKEIARRKTYQGAHTV
jgi:radical SAM protein (TIGR01212 family)